MTRSNRTKAAPKAKKGMAIRRARPARGRRPARIQKKVVVRQEALGQATSNKLTLNPSTPRDSRASVMKSVGCPAFYNANTQYAIQSPAVGIVPAGQCSGLQGYSFTYFAAQAALIKIANLLQGQMTPNVSGESTILSPARYLLESVRGTYSFANRTTAPVSLKIYVLSSKRDTWFSSDPTYSMNYTSPNGTVYSWDGTPQSAWQVGIYAAQGATLPGYDNSWLYPGVLPNESPIFRKYFNIDNEVDVELAQGGVHNMTLNQIYDKVLDASIYANSMLVGIKDVTRFLLFVAQGSPVITDDNGTMTTSPVDIGVIETNEYRYTQTASPATQTYIVTNSLETVAAADLQQINPGSGASTDVIVA